MPVVVAERQQRYGSAVAEEGTRAVGNHRKAVGEVELAEWERHSLVLQCRGRNKNMIVMQS